jgi:hypothetical protein
VVFAATQDGTNPWQAATITNNAVTFNLSSGRGGVAFVTQTGTSYSTTITYGTQAELNGSAVTCTAAVPGTKTVTGSVANVGQTEIANVTLGSSSAFVIPLIGNNFTLQNVPDGTVDLLAVRGTQGASGVQANKFIGRYALTPAAGSVLPVLDFNASEAQTPVQRNVTINGLSAGEVALMLVSFITARGSAATLFAETSGSATATRPVPAIGTTQSGDLHLINIFAGTGTFPFAAYRGILAYMRNSNAQTFTLGPALGTVTVSAAATTPSVRLRTQYTIQPEYNQAWTVIFSQVSGTTTRSVSVSWTAGYNNNAATLDQTWSELSTAAGWQAIWNLVTGTAVNWTFSGARSNVTGVPTTLDGLLLTVAVRTGTLTP